ncbi:MAG: ABC transporter substrate-binding protein [Planctomycetota bacterium]|jgi:oligopeptide transport system substrate-binding protein
MRPIPRSLRFRALLPLLGLVTVLLPGCTQGGLTSANNPDPEGAVRLALATNPPDLDPILISDTTSSGVGSKLFNTLLGYDAELNLVPELATAMPQVSDDGRTYTFELRAGVKFHNGREMTAEDFKYSLERLASGRSKRTNVVRPILGAEKAIEAGRTAGSTAIEGIRVLGPLTLEIELEKPYYPFLHLLSMENAAVIPREAVEATGDGFSRQPVGTGPFVLSEWKENERLVLTANPDYFEGAPTIPRITMRVIKEAITRNEEYKAGNIDMVDITQGVLPQWRASDHSDEIRLYDQASILYYGFNLEKEGSPYAGFGDKARMLREAINRAVDREFICERIVDGRHSPINGIFPPGMPGHSDRAAFTQDVERAKQLLADAGYPGGEGLPPVDLWFNTQGDNGKIAAAIQNDLRAIGIEIVLKGLDWAAFIEATDRGEPAFFRLGWVADYPDPENFLYFLFHSANKGPNGNVSFYGNPEVDALIDQSYLETDAEKRLGLLRQAEEKILADWPWLFLTSAREGMLVKPYIRNFNPTPIDDDSAGGSQVDWREVRVVPETASE